MSAPKGDWRIECSFVALIVLIAVAFTMLGVTLVVD